MRSTTRIEEAKAMQADSFEKIGMLDDFCDLVSYIKAISKINDTSKNEAFTIILDDIIEKMHEFRLIHLED